MVNIGLSSTARVNRKIIAAAAASNSAEVTAVASRTAQRAMAYADEHAIERAHESYDSLLDDPQVDAVYVAAPNALHVDWSIRALEAGKHVLCEKPLSRHPSEVERAFDVAKRTGMILTEGFMYRHNPQTEKLVKLVGDGAIGTLSRIRAAFSFTIRDPGNVRLSAPLDGGSLMDVGCYCVHTARLLAGEPVAVHAEQVTSGNGVDLRFSGLIRFPGDVTCQFESALDLPREHRLEVVGTSGSLILDDPWHARRPELLLQTEDAEDRITLRPVDSYRLQLENFAAAIASRGEPLLRRRDALAQAGALEALRRSAEANALQ